MIEYPNINPVAIEIGSISIYWYGVMYLVSFIIAWFLAKTRAKRLNYLWSNEAISDFIFYCAIGVFLGGRLGYVLFYSPLEFIHNPITVFKIWHGGMSFHGGLTGVIISMLLFARKTNTPFLKILDFTAPLAPIGLTLGRIGNFINAELWGKTTSMPWGILFPNAGPLPRHPSQLYEAFSEGVILFLMLWIYSSKPKPIGTTSGVFLLGYGLIRFSCEFFREPDPQIGFIAFKWLTMGQILSIPMIIIGIVMLWFYKK